MSKKPLDTDDPIVQDILSPYSAAIKKDTTEEKAPQTLEDKVIAQLKTIYDPEIPVDIYALGLIYKVTISDTQAVHIEMTLTTPGCPVAQTFPETVRQSVLHIEEVNAAEVELVWEPPWTPERMSEAARLELGFFP